MSKGAMNKKQEVIIPKVLFYTMMDFFDIRHQVLQILVLNTINIPNQTLIDFW